MRKLLVLEHLTLDGVIQGPGSPEEDTSDGFTSGGWVAAHFDDELGTALQKVMAGPFDLLLGRKTFDIWASYWPHHADAWPAVTTATKYVASNTLTSSDWRPSVFLSGDVPGKVAKIKEEQGPDLHVWGSAGLVQTLMKHDLVDAFYLMIYPVTLGSGKKLFVHGAIPAAFRVAESSVSPTGVIIVRYERAGALILRAI